MNNLTRRDAVRLAGAATAMRLAVGAPVNDICFMTAAELVRKLRAKELSAREVMRAHLSTLPPEPASLRENKSAHVLDKVAMRLLEKDPARRYADALAVLTELSKLTSIADR